MGKSVHISTILRQFWYAPFGLEVAAVVVVR
jgi:hypothetical protein